MRRCFVIRAEASTTIRRPVEEVFRFVTDPTNESTWHTDVAAANRLSAGPIAAGSETKYSFGLSGGRGTAIGKVVAFEENRLETIHFDRGPMGLKPTITFRFEPVGESVRFTRIVEIEPAGVVRFLAPLMTGFVARRNASFLENLRRRLEGSSTPISE
jgi:uncharacterized protein YndB with AHSA1/START domain